LLVLANMAHKGPNKPVLRVFSRRQIVAATLVSLFVQEDTRKPIPVPLLLSGQSSANKHHQQRA
jgi:hypothetical protein